MLIWCKIKLITSSIYHQKRASKLQELLVEWLGCWKRCWKEGVQIEGVVDWEDAGKEVEAQRRSRGATSFSTSSNQLALQTAPPFTTPSSSDKRLQRRFCRFLTVGLELIMFIFSSHQTHMESFCSFKWSYFGQSIATNPLVLPGFLPHPSAISYNPS